MKRPRGLKKRVTQLDLDLYRVSVPIHGLSNVELSVVDAWPDGVETTLLFVHGYAGCAETWEYQINHFAHNYRVVVPDLRGHGQSDAPFTEYTMPELVTDLETIANHLNLPEKFVLVGHSFGGSICVEYANTYPERLQKLVLIATAGEYPLPRAASLLSRVPTAAFRPWWKYRPRWNAEIHVMKRMMLNNMRIWNGWKLLGQINTPTLLITGEHDRYFPRWVFDNMKNIVPDAEVIDIGASKHKVQLERHQAVNRAIERFIGPEEKERKVSWRSQQPKTRLVETRPWLKSYPKNTPYTCPIPQKPVYRFLEVAANRIPNRLATVFYGSKLTYDQLNSRVNQFAHALHGLGVRPGDRVMIVLPNMPQIIIAYYATLKIGGVVVLPNPDANAVQIQAQIRLTEAKVLVTINDFKSLVSGLLPDFPIQVVLTNIRDVVSPRILRQLLTRWKTAGIGSLENPDLPDVGYKMNELMMDASRENPYYEAGSNDLAAILFTSGTTDEPKGVCVTHNNMVANSFQTRHWLPEINYGEETFLAVIPLTHSYGMTTAMNIPIAIGATIILLPVFELQQVLTHIKEYQPTIFPGVPSIYMLINQAPDVRDYGLSSIKACLSGAAPLPIEVKETFEKITKGRLVEGYGLTEASTVTHANPMDGNERTGSIGIPLPNTDAKIVDLISGEDLPSGKIGELLVKGPQVMQGYWREDKNISTDTVLKDGWLYTGDVAVMDADGFFKIISRKRDTILAGEYSLYPRDVEEVLYENSKVLEAAVIGISSEDGQKVKAFVVPRPGTNLSKEELIDLCKKRLDEYAVSWEIEFRDELPKSFIGKVLRRMLEE